MRSDYADLSVQRDAAGKIVINAFPADSDESTDLERIAANCSSDLIKNQIEKEAAKKGGAK